MKRLFLVYNQNSSQYIHVKNEVLSRTNIFKGYMVGKFTIKKTSFGDNVKELKKILENGDTVFALGGDATAAIVANAILESGKDITMSVLPYGNFNDLARTLGTMKLGDVVSSECLSEPLYPLDIIVNGVHWRYATCYATIGMTAEAVELFDEPNFRKCLKRGHRSSWRSYIALAKWYFKNRHLKTFLSQFTINGQPTSKNASDYFAVSGKSVCRIMKGGNDCFDPRKFRSTSDRLVNFWRLFVFMLKSILKRVPGNETTGDLLEFAKPTTLEIQAEGEYQVFENVKTIEIRKANKSIKMIYQR